VFNSGASAPGSMRERARVLRPALTAVLFLGIWHVAVRWSGSVIVPTPWQVVTGMVELARQGLLLKHVVASLFRVTCGYLLAVSLAIPVGALMGLFSSANAFLNPLVQGLRPISPLAWIPLAILWFGVDDLSPIFLIFLASFFPMVVGTAAGVAGIDRRYLRVGRNLEFRGAKFFRAVILPASLPQIVTGMRIGLGVAWLVVVAAEMIAVTSGLGFMIIDARNSGNRYDLVVAGMVLIGLIGLTLDGVMRRLERLDEIRWRYDT
jgi:NitT/TauT family transport system permease protein